jgi:YHS domain-containing protein
MKRDMVCNMDVKDDTSFTTLHGGRKMFFCSNECRQKFLHEPDKYTKAAAEAEKGERKAA